MSDVPPWFSPSSSTSKLYPVVVADAAFSTANPSVEVPLPSETYAYSPSALIAIAAGESDELIPDPESPIRLTTVS